MTLTARTGEQCERLPSTVVNAAECLQEVLAQVISTTELNMYELCSKVLVFGASCSSSIGG